MTKKIGHPTLGATPLSVRVPPDLLAAVDAYILERVPYGEALTRPEAVRRLATEALQKMGLFPVPSEVDWGKPEGDEVW